MHAPDPGGVKSSMEMPLLSATPPSMEGVALSSPASVADTSAFPWLPATMVASPSPGVRSKACWACSWLAASWAALGATSPCRAARFNLRDSGLAIGFPLEDGDQPVAPLPVAALECPLTPPVALLASFLRVRPWPPAPLLSQVKDGWHSCGLQQAMLVLQPLGEAVFGEMLTTKK